MAKQEKEVERWITVNGARVPIFKDGSVGGPPALRKKVESSLKKKSEKKDSFQKAADHEVSNVQNAKENVELLKKELKKHPDDAHTAEIKARLKKAQEDHKKLKKGDTSDSNFKTAKEWDEEEARKKIIKNRQELRKSDDPAKKRKLIEENYELMKFLDKKYESYNGEVSKAAPKIKTPEFKSAEEAEKYYQEKFAGVSSTYANKMAAKLGIEGKGKEKREALAKAYTEKWKQSQSINKDLDLKEKQIARNTAQKESLKNISTSPALSNKSLARKASDNAADAKLRNELRQEMKDAAKGSQKWQPKVGDKISNAGYQKAKNELFNAPEGTVIQMSNHNLGDYIGEYTRTKDGWVGSQQYKSNRRTPPVVTTADGFAMQIEGNDIKVLELSKKRKK